jgi:tetratricopeptide (TPR) repeat protein
MIRSLPASWKYLSAAGALLTGALLVSQSVMAQAGSSDETETKVVPALRFAIGEQFGEAQTCLDEDDIPCAQEILDDIARIRDLNTYERGQLMNFRAFLSFEIDDVDAAIDAYEQMMALPREELPDGLIQSSMRNLATLYLQEDRLQEGLDLYLEWLDLPFVTPSSSDYYLLASVYYQLEQYANGIPALQQAIKLANDRGERGDENWYVLLYVFYYQLEQTDNVIDTLTFLVENWPKRDHMIALAGQLSEQGREDETLTLYETAFDAGFLIRGTEVVQLANLYLNARTPVKAAHVLEDGLESGFIESTQQNWRLLAQAWQLAADHEKALPALEQASRLANDGQVDQLLAQSLARLARWDECADAARQAIDRGGLNDEGYVYMQLGQCLVNERHYEEAREAFQAAARDEQRGADARRWLNFVREEMARERANAEALASLRQN